MHKVYLLLRNNKQQGPFTLEELLQQSLKPFDLVWMEGRSAGWKYPGEIEALKPFVVEQTEEFIPEKEIAVSTLTTAVVKESVTIESKQTKPRNIFLRLPAGVPVIPPVEHEVSLAQKLEKKAEELFKRAQAYSAGEKTIEKENADVDTKYTRSLDDIKEEYANWLYEQKKNKKGVKRKKNLLVAVAILVLAGSFATLKFFFTTSPTVPVSEQKIVVPENAIDHNAPGNPPTVTKKKIKNQVPDLTKNKKEIPTVSKRLSKKNKKVNNSKESPIQKEKDIAQTGPQINENKNQGEKGSGSVALPQLVDISGIYSPDNGNGIQNLKITVKNNSDEVLNVVAVDIVYYSRKGSVTGKNILYFSNLSPHQSMTLTAPDNKKAEDVQFQLGLLSSEDGAIYYAKQ